MEQELGMVSTLTPVETKSQGCLSRALADVTVDSDREGWEPRSPVCVSLTDESFKNNSFSFIIKVIHTHEKN